MSLAFSAVLDSRSVKADRVVAEAARYLTARYVKVVESLEGLVSIQVTHRHAVLGGDQAQGEQMTVKRLAVEHALGVGAVCVNGSMQEKQAFAVRHLMTTPLSERVVVVVRI